MRREEAVAGVVADWLSNQPPPPVVSAGPERFADAVEEFVEWQDSLPRLVADAWERSA